MHSQFLFLSRSCVTFFWFHSPDVLVTNKKQGRKIFEFWQKQKSHIYPRRKSECWLTLRGFPPLFLFLWLRLFVGRLGVMPDPCVVCVLVCVCCFCPGFKGIPPLASWHWLQQHAQQSEEMYIFTLHAHHLEPAHTHTPSVRKCFACVMKQEMIALLHTSWQMWHAIKSSRHMAFKVEGRSARLLRLLARWQTHTSVN